MKKLLLKLLSLLASLFLKRKGKRKVSFTHRRVDVRYTSEPPAEQVERREK